MYSVMTDLQTTPVCLMPGIRSREVLGFRMPPMHWTFSLSLRLFCEGLGVPRNGVDLETAADVDVDGPQSPVVGCTGI